MNIKKIFLKILTVIVGTVIAAYGIDLAIHAGFGSATLAVFWQGLANVLPITLGQASLIAAVLMVVFCLFYDRKQIHVGTIIYQLVYSFCIDFFEPYLMYTDSWVLNFLLMILGIAILSFGSALYSVADFGRGPYEALTFAFVDRNKFSVKNVRIILDIAFVAVGMIMGGKIGACTVATIVLSGIMLQVCVKFLKPVFDRICRDLG